MEVIIDDINYRLYPETKTAEIASKPDGYSGEIIIPSYIVFKDTTYVVKKIEASINDKYEIGPFMGCSKITAIFIPNTVTYIGEDLLGTSDSSLSSIIVDQNNPIYDSRNNCNAIIETSTDMLIAGCKNTIIPDDIKIIAACAFQSTPHNIIFPKMLSRICYGAFGGCLQLNAIYLPNSLQFIEDMAFSGCESLADIEFGNGLQYIGSAAFEDIAITSLILPNSVNFLGDFAFAGCTVLKSITLSKNLTNIGKSVFDNCDSLQIIRVPKGKKEEYCKLGLEPYRDLIHEPQEEEYTILLNIAKGYEMGIGMTKNFAQAVLIYSQAADKGCAEAAFHLGELYELGDGLQQDYQQAIEWYTKAIALYHPSAETRKNHCKQVLRNEEQRMEEYQREIQSQFPQLPTTKYIFFDTECNGLPKYYNLDVCITSNWPRLIQLAWVVTDEVGNIVKRQNYIIKPNGFVINDKIAVLTSINTVRAQREGVELVDALSEFMADIEDAQLVIGHNIDFDMHIVGCELFRENMNYNKLMTKPSICTMQKSTNFCAIPSNGNHAGYKWPKLEELHQKLFGTTFSGAHDAMSDVEATRKCYFELKRKGIL